MSVIYSVLQQTMLFTIPLMIVALGGMFSERSGVANIALEGIVIIGAFIGILFLNITGGKMSGQMQLLLVTLISTATEAVLASLHVYISINMKANQTINGTALSTFVPTFAIFVTRVIQGIQQIQSGNTFRVEPVLPLDSIPFFGPLLFQNTYITMYLGVAILIPSILVLYRTGFGLRLCSCSEYPQATDAAGIDACRTQYADVLISGVLGGLGGLVFTVPISTNFNADVTGYGFPAPAVLIFGQWEPVKITWTFLFFGFMKVVVVAYSGIPFLVATGILSYAYKMIPYVTTLIVLVFISRSFQAPRASGVSYSKGQR